MKNRNPGKTASSIQTVRHITWVGFWINVLLSAFKLMAGFAGSSQTMIADGIHSLSDTVTDAAVIVGSHFWARPPDASHPYGHRRIETLVTLFIGAVLLIAGIGIGWEAVATLRVRHDRPVGAIALAAAMLSIVVKEILYRWTFVYGKKLKSPALKANAWHHRLDALSSIPALIAVASSMIKPAWTFLDHVGALVVSVFIVQAGLKIVVQGTREFIDEGAPLLVLEQIRELAAQRPGVLQVHKVRTRYISSNLQVDLHIVVDGDASVRQGHDIAESVQQALVENGPNIADVVVHIEPHENAIPDDGGED